MYKSGRNCATSPAEPCCTRQDKEVFRNVWSLEDPSGQDYLLTIDENERNVLKSEGWKEICNPFAGPSSFCVDTAMVDGRAGPFIIYSVQQANTRALYRCYTGKNHFFSPDPGCEGQKTESLMGYISTTRGGETLRALSRCLTPSGAHIHALDLQCDRHDAGTFGYVR
jgi:hypothetical protein